MDFGNIVIRVIKAISLLLGILYFLVASAYATPDYGKIFDRTDACYLLVDTNTNKSLTTYGSDRCSKRFPPCSTFKFPLNLIAFEESAFKTSDDVIPWDKKRHSRKELNQDQTPTTWMQRSAVWVSEVVIGKIGIKKVSSYLKRFAYGDQNVSSEGTFWNGGSLNISPNEQARFLRAVQLEEFGLKKTTIDKFKTTLLSKEMPDGTKVYVTTGTCCLDRDCRSTLGREIGWFVGFTEKGSDSKTFVVNFSIKKPVKSYAGPRAKEMFFKILEQQVVN